MKKIFVLLLTLVMVFCLGACTNDDNPAGPSSDRTSETQGTKPNDTTSNNPSSNNDLTQSFAFMGYNVFYPTNANKNPSDYGFLVGDSNYCVVIEAPATAGVIFEADKIEDAPSLCEQYLKKTLESKIRSLFSFEQTEISTTSSSKVTNNGCEMLRVVGTAKNNETGKNIEFSAIYLLAGENNNIPVYIVGVPMVSGYNVDKIIDGMALKISK